MMRPDDIQAKASTRWLALDSSTPTMTLAVMEGQTLLAESHSLSERNHSIRLIPAVEELLRSVNMKLTDIEAIAAGRGPGSYTGVRIAVTVAKTMSWALDVPLVGVSSLEALAHGCLDRLSLGVDDPFWLIPLLNARRGQVYTGLYATGKGSWECLAPDGIRQMSSWIATLGGMLGRQQDQIAENRSARLIFVGEVEPFYQEIEALQQRPGFEEDAVRHRVQAIRAYDVGLLAGERWLRGEHDAAHAFVPNYTQLAEAEKKWQDKQS